MRIYAWLEISADVFNEEKDILSGTTISMKKTFIIEMDHHFL